MNYYINENLVSQEEFMNQLKEDSYKETYYALDEKFEDYVEKNCLKDEEWGDPITEITVFDKTYSIIDILKALDKNLYNQKFEEFKKLYDETLYKSAQESNYGVNIQMIKNRGKYRVNNNVYKIERN